MAALCQTNINVQTLTVEAALTGRREHIYHAVMLDPHTSTVLTLDKIWAMCDELIAAHQKHGLLGDFAPTIPGTGRAYAGTGDRVFAEAKLSPTQTTTKGKLEAEVSLRNLGKNPFEADLTVDCVDLMPEAKASEGTASLQVTVPAGKTIQKKVLLPWAREHRDGFALRLSSPNAGIITRDYVIPRRRILAAGDKEGAPFELKLAGFPAVEGNIAVRPGIIALRFAVDDTNVVPGPRPWQGSSIELFFVERENREIFQMFLVPQKGVRKVRVLDRKLRPLSGVRTRIATASNGAGYEMNIEIPLGTVGLAGCKMGFLFDTIVHPQRLGRRPQRRTYFAQRQVRVAL